MLAPIGATLTTFIHRDKEVSDLIPSFVSLNSLHGIDHVWNMLSQVAIHTCSQKEHILHHTGSGSHVVCDHTGLVQYNLGDTER